MAATDIAGTWAGARRTGAGDGVFDAVDVRFVWRTAAAGDAIGVAPALVFRPAAGVDLPGSQSMAGAVLLDSVG
ncbi:hypothetical protein D3C76_1750260 [compost metagenome]